jgi:hypothetical protein
MKTGLRRDGRYLPEAEYFGHGEASSKAGVADKRSADVLTRGSSEQ